jgi:predicted solute-binding protein
MKEKLMIFKITTVKAKKTIIKVVIVVRTIMAFRIIRIEVEEDIKTNVHLLEILIKRMVVLVISTTKKTDKLERTL